MGTSASKSKQTNQNPIGIHKNGTRRVFNRNPMAISSGHLVSPAHASTQVAYDTKTILQMNVKKSNQIWLVPLMPSDEEEIKACTCDEIHCCYCKYVCQINYLKCKVCPKVAHINCLYNRGYLNDLESTSITEWSCADCSDLSRLLSDSEMHSLIDLFDKLDPRNTCIIRCEEYMKAKKQIFEQLNVPMTAEDERIERKHFCLMDTDNNGVISYHDFINYETRSLLAKKNKVELANFLTLKELVLIKKLFSKYDRTKDLIIKPEEAKIVYKDYYTKLKPIYTDVVVYYSRNKLGRSFQENVRSCEQLFGLHSVSKSSAIASKKIDHSVSWDEFVRKLTILILFDRINPANYAPKAWNPHISCGNKSSIGPTMTRLFSIRPHKSIVDSQSIFTNQKLKLKLNGSTTIDTVYLMKNDMKLETYDAYDYDEFGSSLYVISPRTGDNGTKSEHQRRQHCTKSLEDILKDNGTNRVSHLRRTGGHKHISYSVARPFQIISKSWFDGHATRSCLDFNDNGIQSLELV